MPVGTRSTFGTGGLAQPAGMVADSRSRSTVTGQNENKSGNEQQQNEEELPAPPPKTPVASHIEDELVNVEAELASAREIHAKLLSRGSRPSSQRLSQLARRIALERKETSPKASPVHTFPSMEGASAADVEDIGAVIGASVKTAIDEIAKSDKRGSFILKEEAKQIGCDLTKPKRIEFASTILTRATLVDPRIRELRALKWTTPEEFQAAITAAGLTHLDERLAATIYASVAPKEAAPVVALLMKATIKDPMLAVSGMRMLDWISKQGMQNSTGKHKRQKAVFDATTFLKPGLSEELTMIACSDLLEAIDVLPGRYTEQPLDKHELVIEKIPPSCMDEHWVKQLTHELERAVLKGGEEPWTLDELCAEIAERLVMEPADGPSAHAAATRPKGDPKKPAAKEKTSPKDDGGARARKYGGKPVTGTMGRWLDGGKYAFIKVDGDDDGDVFCHNSSVIGDKPSKGDKVTLKIAYETVTLPEGDTRREFAKDVKLGQAANVHKAVVSAAAVQTNGEQDSDDSDDDDGAPPTHYRAIVR